MLVGGPVRGPHAPSYNPLTVLVSVRAVAGGPPLEDSVYEGRISAGTMPQMETGDLDKINPTGIGHNQGSPFFLNRFYDPPPDKGMLLRGV